MAILLTGGAGYIGSHTCIELVKAGHDVVIVDNFYNSKPETLRRINELCGREVPFYNVDIRDEAGLTEVFRRHNIEAVIHFAGLKAVGESVAQPWRYYDNNLNSTLVLTKVMERFGVKKIIFSSSATVYSEDNEMPLRENGRTGDCRNPYGWTKYMTEQILSGMAHADSAWSIVLLRYFNPIGAHESGCMGEDPRGIPNNLMPYITQAAVGRREKLSVFGNDYDTHDGTGVRDYIHVVDLAKGHVAAVKYVAENTGCEVFNLGTGTGYSVLDMVKAFNEANGLDIPYAIAPRRPGDIATCYADPSKSEKILGWKAEKNLQDMCRDSWNWQKNNPNGYEE